MNARTNADVGKSMKRAGWIAALAPLLCTLGCSFSVPPPVPVGAPVPIAFSAPSSEGTHKIAISGAGRPEQSCEAPCTLQVPSGSALVSVTGPRRLLVPAVIPAEASKAEIKYQRRGQAIAGWVLALVGVTGGSIALAATRNSGPDGQLKGGIAGASLAGAGLVGVIVALTAGKDEVRFSADPAAAAAPAK